MTTNTYPDTCYAVEHTHGHKHICTVTIGLLRRDAPSASLSLFCERSMESTRCFLADALGPAVDLRRLLQPAALCIENAALTPAYIS